MKKFFFFLALIFLILSGIFVIKFFPIFPKTQISAVNWHAKIPENPHCENLQDCVEKGDALADELFGNHDFAFWHDAFSHIQNFDSSISSIHSGEENFSEEEILDENFDENFSETENFDENFSDETIFDEEILNFSEENFVPPAEEDETNTDARIAYYTVSGNNISLKIAENFSHIDRTEAEDLWEIFTLIIPYEWRKNLYSYQIFSGVENMGAFIGMAENMSENDVEKIFTPRSYNIFGLNVDAFGDDSHYDVLTFLHEFAHLFSLSDEQSGNVISCHIPGIFECSYPNSYLQDFYEIFWEKFPAEDRDHSEKTESENREFFENFQDEFINLYASGNPNEDFAENFTAFIIRPYSALDADAVIDQKQLFFYQYPEIVVLRLQILENLKMLTEMVD